jgi:hypothetical protein
MYFLYIFNPDLKEAGIKIEERRVEEGDVIYMYYKSGGGASLFNRLKKKGESMQGTFLDCKPIIQHLGIFVKSKIEIYEVFMDFR